jgi:hypothetical protein
MIDTADLDRLHRMMGYVRTFDTVGSLRILAPRPLQVFPVNQLSADCTFLHGGLLVFPDAESEVVDLLESCEFKVINAVPSVVVKSRLCHSYGLDPNVTSVTIIHGRDVSTQSERQIEVFVLTRCTAALANGLVDCERHAENDSHFAYEVHDPTVANLSRLRRLVTQRLALRPDGGGFNPYERLGADGCSVLYFAAPAPDAESMPVRRMELTCPNHYPSVIATHLRETAATGTGSTVAIGPSPMEVP